MPFKMERTQNFWAKTFRLCHHCPIEWNQQVSQMSQKNTPNKTKNISHPAKTDSHGAKLQGTLAVETVYQEQAALPCESPP